MLCSSRWDVGLVGCRSSSDLTWMSTLGQVRSVTYTITLRNHTYIISYVYLTMAAGVFYPHN